MKIVFSDIPMRRDLNALHYKVEGNSKIEYKGKVIFPVNSALARLMKKDERVKVVLLAKEGEGNYNCINIDLFKRELDEINSDIGAKIEYVIISNPFCETRSIHEKTILAMIEQLERNAQIISDITYGPKSLPIIQFTVLNFAEKFFGDEILNIIYGKVDFVKDENGENLLLNPIIYDMTALYYLNTFTNRIDYKNPEQAVETLKILFEI